MKTRLAARIGDAAACEAYIRLTEATLSHLKDEDNVELRFSPDDAGAEISRWLRSSWKSSPQGEGDLGARLERAAASAFLSGCQKVVIIGTDCPYMRRSDIEAACRALDTKQVVLGPAEDGGYWLMGLSAPVPELFINVPWSTPTVFETTLQRARTNRLEVEVLRILEDVDTEVEWRRFLEGGGA